MRLGYALRDLVAINAPQADRQFECVNGWFCDKHHRVADSVPCRAVNFLKAAFQSRDALLRGLELLVPGVVPLLAILQPRL